MDDFGHFSGAYITTKAYLKQYYPQLTTQQRQKLSLLGGVLGVTPDLDAFWCLFKKREGYCWNPWKDPWKHHQFISHTPAFYSSIYAALTAVAHLTKNKKLELFSEIFMLGAMTHFLLDSMESDGIAWLYPFKKKQFAWGLRDTYGVEHWKKYYKSYSGLFEFGLLVSAIGLYFYSRKHIKLELFKSSSNKASV